MAHEKQHHTLNNILNYLSPLQDRQSVIGMRDDYIFETPKGCFRVAYSPSTHTMALFYNRHPDDLAAVPDHTGDHGIAYKDRVILIGMYQLYHDSDGGQCGLDGRQQFDMSWVRPMIMDALHDIPRSQFREANLHRISEKMYSSVFMGYGMRPSLVRNGYEEVDIITKTNENFTLLADRKITTELAHRAGRLMMERRMQDSFPLRSIDPVTDVRCALFKDGTVHDVIAADHASRVKMIWDAVEPVKWGEAPTLPIYRSGAFVREHLQKFAKKNEEDREDLIREAMVQAGHFFMGGKLVEFTLGYFLDVVGKFGKKEKLGNVPAEWHRIVDSRAHRLRFIDSYVHRRMIKPDPKHFRDMRWINPAEHHCTVAHDGKMLDHNPERIFGRWMQSHFLAPWASMLDYRGKGYEPVSLDQLDQMRVMQAQVSNGMMLYYVPSKAKLYGYYNNSHYYLRTRKLPFQSEDFFKKDEVLEIDMKGGDLRMRRLPFLDFQTMIRKIAEAPDLNLVTPDAPVKEEINKPLGPETPSNAILGHAGAPAAII